MPQPSYVHGASPTPLIGETIGVHFDHIAERFADRDALVSRHQNISWTYRELKERVDAFAAGLLALGLEPGERVGIWSPNNADWVIAQFATAKAGLILVNINPAYRVSELEYALNKAGVAALITAQRFKTSDYVGTLRELAPELPSGRQPARTALGPAACPAPRDQHRRGASARHAALRRRAGAGRPGRARTSRRARRPIAI